MNWQEASKPVTSNKQRVTNNERRETMSEGGKAPMVAFLLEFLIGGFLGFLGIGWIYTGRVLPGLILLIAYCALWWTTAAVLVILTAGVWLVCIPVQNLLFGAISGYFAYRAAQST
jgi:hypothetical protein